MKYEITSSQLSWLEQWGGHQDFHNEESLRLELSKLAEEIREQSKPKVKLPAPVQANKSSYPRNEY